MIAFLRGRLAIKDLTHVVVDVQGVGYDLLVPLSTYDKLPRVGEEVTLVTTLVHREDAMVLYGFGTESERQLFLVLVNTVSGVGPKLALNILSSMPVDSFCAAIAGNDLKALTRISGIGKRSAERLVVELHDRIGDLAPAVSVSGKAPAVPLDKGAEDAVAGLITLGFKPDAARTAVRELAAELPREEATAQNLIRKALARLNR